MYNATIYAMSTLFITVAAAAVFFLIFFMIMYAIFWGILLVLKAIKGLVTLHV